MSTPNRVASVPAAALPSMWRERTGSEVKPALPVGRGSAVVFMGCSWGVPFSISLCADLCRGVPEVDHAADECFDEPGGSTHEAGGPHARWKKVLVQVSAVHPSR